MVATSVTQMTLGLFVNVVCLTLTVLVCSWGPGQVHASSRNDGQDIQERSRLMELLDIASHLEGSDYRQKRQDLTSNDEVDEDDVNRLWQVLRSRQPRFGWWEKEVEDQLFSHATRRQEFLVRNRRQNALDTFRDSYYKLWYDCLVTFVTELVTKLKDDAPAEVQAVILLPYFFPLDDPAFVNYDADAAIQKTYDMLLITNFVLDTMRVYVKEEELGWYDSQVTQIRVYQNIVEIGIATVSTSGDIETYSDMPTGIGGINVDGSADSPVDLSSLADMLTFLENENSKK